MITGLGIDIIEVTRVAAAYAKFGNRFLQRLLLPAEIDYCLSHRQPAPFIAARFAAKEAASKALGTGIGTHLAWHDVEVRRQESGEPYFILHPRALALVRRRGSERLLLSLSHTAQYAAAVALLG